MKYFKILTLTALLPLAITSCDEQIMEWGKDPNKGDVTTSELPLELSEKITRYEALNTYTDLILGNGIGVELYLAGGAYTDIVNANFDDVTPGYAMKHGAMVQSSGDIKFDIMDDFVSKTKAAGLSIYGHTLVWHSNQNASYLNSLIAPTVIPGTSGSNALDLSGLQNKSLDGWGAWNAGDGISVVDGEGLSSSSQAVKLVSSSTSSAAYNLQLQTPDITVVNGHNYEISFYIKSDKSGEGRISFDGLSNNYPWQDWYGTGASFTESFTTSSQWQQVKFSINDFTGNTFKINFDLGYIPSVTYYIDVDNIQVVDLDAAPTVTNMLANGDFETGINGWSKWNGAADALSAADATNAYEGSGAMKVIADAANSGAGSQWKTQINSSFTANLTAGEDYTISYYIKSEATGSVRCSTTGTTLYQGDQTTSPTWKLVEWVITADGGETGLNFDLGGVAGTYYIDNVLVTTGQAGGGGSGPTIIEKTDAEKKAIISDAMEDWISQMVTHFKNDVKAWDVVNEPIKDGNSGDIRDGSNPSPEDDYFSWVKYIGKDFAVDAFNLARQYGNPTDKLFINDYGLESNLDKCDGLINYTAYIESQGATVDGIGTQMHISLDTDKDMMVEMFKKLAASGKLIKISELDIRLGTNAPTPEQLAAQSEMYQFVIDMYNEHIPEGQQFGITLWGVSDNENEHEYWLPDESPNIWNANYNRKHAYKGTADGLAGRDVSEDFTGELVP